VPGLEKIFGRGEPGRGDEVGYVRKIVATDGGVLACSASSNACAGHLASEASIEEGLHRMRRNDQTSGTGVDDLLSS
jgi:hypothetical protein